MVHNKGKNQLTGRPPACGVDGCWMREEGCLFLFFVVDAVRGRKARRQKFSKRWCGLWSRGVAESLFSKFKNFMTNQRDHKDDDGI